MSLAASPKCTANSTSLEKSRIKNWLLKWASSDNLDKDVVMNIPIVAGVFQAIGFRLVLLESETELQNTYTTTPKDDENTITVSVACAKSGMRAVLAKKDAICKIYSDDAQEKNLFVSSDNVPPLNEDAVSKIGDFGNTLLPELSKETKTLIREVIFKLFSIINTSITECDINQNEKLEEVKTPLGTFPSLDALHNIDNFDKIETKQQIWEIDPKTSPPIGTSSPIRKSLDHMCSDRDNMLVDILQDAKNSIEKALSCLPIKNNTFTKSIVIPVKRVSNIIASSPSPILPVTNKTPTNNPVKAIVKRLGSPKKLLTPKKLPTPKKINKLTPLKAGKTFLFQPKTDSPRKNNFGSPLQDKSKSGKYQDTPRPGTPTTRKGELRKLIPRNPILKHVHLQRSTTETSTTPKSRSEIPSTSKIPNFAFKRPK